LERDILVKHSNKVIEVYMNIFKRAMCKSIAAPLVISAIILHTSQAWAGEKVSLSLPSDEVTNVVIENHSGLINVVGWNKDKVSVTGELDDEAQELIFEQKGAQIHIKVEYENANNWSSDGSLLTIFMPKDVRVNFSSVSSDLTLKNLHGGIEAATVSGNIQADEASDNIELSSISGNIKSTDLSGKISLSVVSGDINDKNSSGRIQVKAVSGEIDIESNASEVFFNNVSGNSELKLSDVIELRMSTVSGDIDVEVELKEKGLIKASSVSGDIDLAFQKNINADFRLNTNVGGDLINKLSSDKAVYSEYVRSAKLNFQLGDGNSSVSVSTVNGNVKVSSK
jgi:DUF4097 and DUF4098 domain-containing protein YvlB